MIKSGKIGDVFFVIAEIFAEKSYMRDLNSKIAPLPCRLLMGAIKSERLNKS